MPRKTSRSVMASQADASFPDDVKQRLMDALRRAGVNHQVETYEGAKHGWVPTDTPVHDPAAAERHWRTLIALLDATLKAREA